jgi:hypothetical protein
MCKAHFDIFEQMTPHVVTLSCSTSALPMCKAYFDTFELMTPQVVTLSCSTGLLVVQGLLRHL